MTKKGFTLIELMVTVSIMLIMTSIVIFNYGKFNDSTALNSFAYDMALTIRQSQVYGVAAKESGNSQSQPITIDNNSALNFSNSYGVHFDKTPSVPSPFNLFADTDDDGHYDTGEELQTYTFQRGINIYQLCVTDNDGEHCDVNSLDITFKRPNPDAIILAFDTSGASMYSNGNSDTISSARVVLHNSDGSLTRSVVVYSTGQISVQ